MFFRVGLFTFLLIILSAANSPAASVVLVVSQIQTQLQGVKYKIDDLLNISTVRKFSISILPDLALINNTTNQPAMRLPDGTYRIRLTLFKGDHPEIQSGEFLGKPNAKHFIIDSVEKSVTAIAGRIISTIEFDISDPIVSGARNTLALEILPIEKGGAKKFNWASQVYLTQFIPSNETSIGIISNAISEINHGDPQKYISELISEFKQIKQQNQRALTAALTVSAFAKEFGLELINLNEKDLPYQIDRTLFRELNESGLLPLEPNSANVTKFAENVRLLCHQAYVENVGFWGLTQDKVSHSRRSQYRFAQETATNCMKQPFKYFDFDQKLHVKRIDPNVRSLGGSSQNFNIISNFEMNSSQALSSSLRQSSTASFNFGTKLLNIFRTGTGVVPLLKDIFAASFDYTLSHDSSLVDAESQGQGYGISFSRGLYLIEQQASFEINLLEYTPCISIIAKEEVLRKIFGSEEIHPLFRGFHVCDSVQNKPVSIAETYYAFSQHFAFGDFLDSRSLENRPFVMSLRGFRDYYVFLNLNNGMLNSKDLENSEKSNPKKIVSSGMTLFSHQQKAFPGVYSAVTKPSQLQFIRETSHSNRAKEFFSYLGNSLSPWARKDLQPIGNSRTNFNNK